MSFRSADSPARGRGFGGAPTRAASGVFWAKVQVLRARRTVVDLCAGPSRPRRGPAAPGVTLLALSRTAMWSDERLSERAHQVGKVQNLRLACRALDGLSIGAGEIFSFWKCVGPPTAARGFAVGRMLRQGCMVPAVGGGLCQLSNALYDVALRAGCRIVERHAHTRVVPGSAAEAGRDATVAWNYIDLRFSPDRPMRLEARLERDALVVRLLGESAELASPPPVVAGPACGSGEAAGECAHCGRTACFRYEGDRPPPRTEGRRVFMLDEGWPEFRRHIAEHRRAGDTLATPLAAPGRGIGRYAWRAADFDRVVTAPVLAVGRSWDLRSVPAQGPARRLAEARATGRLAARLSRALTREVLDVTVAQSFLPYLWRLGALGGRRVTVLMTRLPMAELHAALDAAAAARPEFATLRDFRADDDLVEAERRALAEADEIITPHARIAALFGERARRLAWSTPESVPRSGPAGRFIAFAGPTAARKGAAAVREAARRLGVSVMPLGSEVEGVDFWDGVDVRPAGDWRAALAVVQPAWVEDQPRRLLAAMAAGVPVIASPACGLDPAPGLTLVPPDDAEALIAALGAVLGSPVVAAPRSNGGAVAYSASNTTRPSATVIST